MLCANDISASDDLPMKVMVMTASGGTKVLQMQDVTTPTLHGPHDVLVRINAANVNSATTKLRNKGTYPPKQSPPIRGCDGIGVVKTVGRALRGHHRTMRCGTAAAASAAPAVIMPNMPW
jgi:NADPH:quinone reductase-like Zn-dependent oxidoreductase